MKDNCGFNLGKALQCQESSHHWDNRNKSCLVKAIATNRNRRHLHVVKLEMMLISSFVKSYANYRHLQVTKKRVYKNRSQNKAM